MIAQVAKGFKIAVNELKADTVKASGLYTGIELMKM